MRLHSDAKSKCDAIVRTLLDWFAQAARDLPWRRTHNPYAIWVSEIILLNIIGQAVDSRSRVLK